ncbi:hypothetical protein LguiA_005244 [Lonicera macranthoides]
MEAVQPQIIFAFLLKGFPVSRQHHAFGQTKGNIPILQTRVCRVHMPSGTQNIRLPTFSWIVGGVDTVRGTVSTTTVSSSMVSGLAGVGEVSWSANLPTFSVPPTVGGVVARCLTTLCLLQAWLAEPPEVPTPAARFFCNASNASAKFLPLMFEFELWGWSILLFLLLKPYLNRGSKFSSSTLRLTSVSECKIGTA